MAVMIDQWKAVLEERQVTILSLDQVEQGIENNPDSDRLRGEDYLNYCCHRSTSNFGFDFDQIDILILHF